MAVPKRRTSRTKRNTRRANHDKIKAPALVACPNCGSPTRPHHACASCGTYKGRDVLPKADEAAEE